MKCDVRPLDQLSLSIRLFRHISRRRKYQFIGLLALTLITSMAEVVSLGAIVPFIGILTQPERVLAVPAIWRTAHDFGLDSAQELMLPLTVVFVFAALIAAILRLLLLWVSIRLTNAIGVDLSSDAYGRTLHQPYSVHIARSSSEIISGITHKVDTTTRVLEAVITVITSLALFLAILATLIAIDPIVTAFASIGFGISYGLIAWSTRRRLRSNGRAVASQQTNVVKALQEGLGAIRDILLDGTQKVYKSVYQQSIQELRRASGENQFITVAPRFVMEAFGMILVAWFALVMSQKAGGVGAALPILGALALGAQRLLPLLQQMYLSWSFIAGNQASLYDVIKLLEQPLPAGVAGRSSQLMAFESAIVLDDVSFRYGDDSPWILCGVNLTIRKGGRIGFIGTTGSGKSTLLDLLMCLLQPTRGRILIDGVPISDDNRRQWQRTIAHVPQHIYLSEASFAENIAFGVPADQIDLDRVRHAAKQAQLAEFIENHRGGYLAVVGERGIRLSGGQRQRIGIARALYKNAIVLVFDEATSALDTETEKMVMESIDCLSSWLTVLIVAHRLTTLKNCSQVFELDNAGVRQVLQQVRAESI